MASTNERADCRIYVADLAAYNSGRLRGAWINLDGKPEGDVWNEINAMLALSPESNVTRRKCEDCGHHQDARHVADGELVEPADCNACGGTLSAPFPSAEEWAVHDHEGFAGLIKSEWPNIGELVQLAEILNDEDEDKRRGLLWLINDRGFSVADAIERAEEVRTYESDAHNLAADYAEEFASDVIENFDKRASEWPFNCIDWERAGRELTMGGDIDETEQDGERFLVTNASEF